ncbi:MAG: HAD family phosphatase [Candidatus Saccharimonadales bacterium]
MSQPFAVFDIDGTVIRWQLYHAMVDALMRQGYIDKKRFEKVRVARMVWKRRVGSDSFNEYEHEIVKVFDEALTGLPVNMLEMAAQTVFGEYKEQVYAYTRTLIHDLKAQGYLVFVISGSPSLIVKKLADYYDFDDYAATEYPEKNGYFTGEKKLSIGRKGELLQDLIDKHSLEFAGSVGVGDSEGDIAMLELCERPIAFNPSKKLYEHAQANSWEIVVERKNVIYRMSAEQGHYHLDP